MDVPIGELCLGQPVLQTDRRGQSLLGRPGAGLHRPLGKGEHQVVGDPGGQGIDGDDAAGGVPAVRGLKDGVDHGPAAPMLLHHSEKDILLPGAEGALHIALVEKGEVEGPCLIHHPQLDQLQPPADPGQTGMLRGHGPDAHLPAQRGGADGVDLPAVLVVLGEVGEQLGAPGQSQLLQLFRPGLSHSGELVQGGIQCDGHRRASFPSGRDPVQRQYFTTSFWGRKGRDGKRPGRSAGASCLCVL